MTMKAWTVDEHPEVAAHQDERDDHDGAGQQA